MTPGSPSIQAAPVAGAATGERTGLFSLLGEVIAICARAQAAAHVYEELKPLSDQALAARGLTRADLARAAFMKLSETW